MCCPGTGVEPHDAVVHENTGFGQHHLGAEYRQQGLGERHHVSFAIHDAQVGGAGGCGGLAIIAQCRQTFGIGLQQTVGETRVHGGVRRRSRRCAIAEQIQGAAQCGAGGELGGPMNMRTPVAEGLCRNDAGLVVGQIRLAYAAVESLQVTHQILGDFPLVEIPRPGLCQTLQGGRQATQFDVRRRAAPFTRRHVSAGQIDTRTFHEFAQLWRGRRDLQGRVPIHVHAAPGKRDGRLQSVAPTARAKTLQGRRHAGDEAGYGHGIRPDHVAVIDHCRPTEQIPSRFRRPAGSSLGPALARRAC